MQVSSNQQRSDKVVALPENLTPARIVEIEIGNSLPWLSAFDEKTGKHYWRARCLIRLHTYPLGIVEIPLPEEKVSPDEYAKLIWSTLHEEINAHLRQDGLQTAKGLDASGLFYSSTPGCIEEREKFLAQAPFVSVIVSTHDRPEKLSLCLNALLSLHYPQYEIIVVDNAPSSSATFDFMHETYQNASQIRYLRENRKGLSWARNCGLKEARGSILAFTDDDVVVDPYWLVELVRSFNLAENIVCVTGTILPLEIETPEQIWFEEYGGFNKGFTPHIFDMKEHHPKTPLYPYTAGRFGTGASIAFTLDYLQKVGGFDTALGIGTPARGGEDLAAFFQAIISGYKLVYTPSALLYHPHYRNYPGLRNQIYGYGVGLTAYLTKILLDRPLLLLNFITKMPYGFYFILSNRSSKNRKKSTYYPKELTAVERKGMLHGPLAYMASRRALSRAATIETGADSLQAKEI